VFRTHLAVALILTLTPACLPAVAQTDNAKLKQEVTKLFELGQSVKTRAEAKAHFERLREMAPADGRVTHAYILVQLTHRHYSDADKLLAELLAKDKTNLDAWEVKIWLSTLTKKHGRAVVEMMQVAKLLASQADLPLAQGNELANFLGRICGYLEGMGQLTTRPVIRPNEVQSITAKMTDSQRSTFEEGRRETLDKLTGQTDKTDDLKAEAIRAEAKRRGMQMQELDRRRKEAATQLAEVEGNRDELIKNRKAEIDEITKRERQSLAELRSAEARSVGLRRELVIIDNRIANLVLEVEDPDTTPAERHHLLNDISRWELTRTRLRTELVEQDSRLVGSRERMTVIHREKSDIEDRYGREIGKIDGLRRTVDSIDRDKSRLLRAPISGNTRRVRSHKSRAVALTNYIKLPIVLDAEKKRLLDSFR